MPRPEPGANAPEPLFVRTALIALIVLLVLAVGAVLIGPSLIDWNVYKDRATVEVRKATGRDFRIEGDLSLSVLPTPTLTAVGVHLGNVEGGTTPEMVALRAVQVRVALLPLIEGRVEVESVILVEPTIVLERLADGRDNWSFEPAPSGDGGATVALPGATPPAGAGPPFEVQLNDLRIQQGVLIYRDAAAGTEERIDEIDATVAAGSLDGPYRLAGSLRARGMPLDVEIGIGALQEDRAIPVSAAIGIKDAGAAEFSGIVAGYPNEPRVTGQLEAAGEDLAAIVTAAGGVGPAALARPFGVEGTLTGSETAVALNDLSLRLGDTLATGAIDADLEATPQVNVVLNIGQIDLDALLATPPAVDNDTALVTGVPTEEETAPAPVAVPSFALPGDVLGTVEIKVDAATYRRNVVRQVRLAAELANGEVTVSQAAALLPGGSDVTLFGTILAANGQPKFEGQVEANSDNLRGLLDWLAVDVGAVPADRLRRLSAAANVAATPDNLTLTGIDVQVDVSRLRGGVAIALRDRPGFGVGLSLDKINLDAYLPPAPAAAAAPATAADGTTPAPPAAAPALSEQLGALAALDPFDAILQLQAGNVTYRGTALNGLKLDGTLQGGALALRELAAADIGGNGIALAGTLTDLGEAPRADLELTLDARNAPALMALLDVELPDALRAAKVAAKLNGDLARLALGTTVETLGGRATARGSISGLDAEPSYQLALDVKHPSLDALARAWSGEGGVGGDAGAVSLIADVAGDLRQAQIDATLELGDGALDLDGTLSGLDAAPAANLALALTHAELARLIRLVDPDYRPALPQLGAVDLKTQATYATGVLELAGLDGRLGPAAVQGGLKLDTAGTTPRLDATLATSEIIVDWFLPVRADTGGGTSGTGSGGDNADTRRWSREPIDLDGLHLADGRIALSAPAIEYTGYRVSEPRVELALDGGVLTLRELSGEAYGGSFGMTGRLAAAGVDGDVPAAAFRVQIDNADAAALTGAQAATGPQGGMVGGVSQLLFPVSGVTLASGRLGADIDVTSRGTSEFELVSNLAGPGRVTFTDALIAGVDLCRISAQLDQLNGLEGFLGLVAAGQGGQTKIADFEGRFALERGIATLPQRRLTADCATVDFQGTVDLPRWLIDTQARALMPEHPEFPGIVVAQRGALDRPNIRLVNLNDVQQYLVGRAAENLIRKLTPEQQQPQQDTAPQATPEAEPEKQRPEELFQGVLQDLLKKR